MAQRQPWKGIKRLNFTVICSVASFLDGEDFKAFVSTCRTFAASRDDVRTLAHVLVNTGDVDENRVLEFGSIFIRFYAQNCAEDLPYLGLRAVHIAAYEGNDRPLKALKPLLSAP